MSYHHFYMYIIQYSRQISTNQFSNFYYRIWWRMEMSKMIGEYRSIRWRRTGAIGLDWRRGTNHNVWTILMMRLLPESPDVYCHIHLQGQFYKTINDFHNDIRMQIMKKEVIRKINVPENRTSML